MVPSIKPKLLACSSRLYVICSQLIFPVLSPTCYFLYITYCSVHPPSTPVNTLYLQSTPPPTPGPWAEHIQLVF